MIELFNNFLSSGHSFSKSDNLQKFRFSLLNIFMLIAIISASIHLFMLLLGLLEYSKPFVISLGIFIFVSTLFQYLLRVDKSYYLVVVNIFLFTSLALFYFVLFTHPEDEFRLISFFLLTFITFVLRGKIIMSPEKTTKSRKIFIPKMLK